jgi:hypothetical protein
MWLIVPVSIEKESTEFQNSFVAREANSSPSITLREENLGNKPYMVES